MEKGEALELHALVRLIEQNQEVATVEKYFGFSEVEDEEDHQKPVETIDETITRFIQEIESKAQELGRIVRKEELARITISTILFLIKRSQTALTLDIEVEKQKTEEKENADTNSDT